MSREGSLGHVKVVYLPTCADHTAPTLAEISAGTEVTSWLTRDGVDTPSKGKTIPTADISQPYDTTTPGAYGGDPISFKFFRDTVEGSDTAWATFPRATAGFALIARFGGSGSPSSLTPALNALATGDRCEIWPITVIAREPAKTAEGEAQTFMVTCSVPVAPEMDAAVGA